MGNISKFLIPIPPLAEQHRIVAKVDELMAICDQLKVKLQQSQETQVQLTDALKVMAHSGNVYAYNFKGKRYDTGNKLGFLKATVEYALRRDDLGPAFKNYLSDVVRNLS